MTAADHKIPPNNAQAEQYILRAALYDPSSLPAVHEILGNNSFYFQRHKEIFDAILDLHELGEEIDLSGVIRRLEYKGLGREDDYAVLLNLSDEPLGGTKIAGNAVASAKLVRRAALQRKQRELGQQMIEKPDLDREKLKRELAEIENELAQLDGQAVRDPWKIFSLKDAYTERQPLQYVIGGLFTLPSLSILFGPPATLKSFLLADAAVCVAGGLSWLGREVIQSPVLWIDFDNGSRRCHERVEALGRSHGLPETVPFHYCSMPNPWLDSGNLHHIENLIRRINGLEAKLICIDNLGLVTGGMDENTSEMIGIMSNLRFLSEQTGAAVTVIHHERKSSSTGERSGASLRGHTSIEASLDLALQVEREQHSNIVTIKSTKTRDIDILPFGSEFRYEHKVGTGELSTALFVPYEIEDTLSDHAIEMAIKDVLAASPLLNQTELVSKVKTTGIEAGKHRIRPIAERMADLGRIVVSHGPRGSKLYSLT